MQDKSENDARLIELIIYEIDTLKEENESLKREISILRLILPRIEQFSSTS